MNLVQKILIHQCGLLLRADLHTLFDLDLMGIHPKSLIIHFHPSAIVAVYDIFEGKKLKCYELKPSQKALSKKMAILSK